MRRVTARTARYSSPIVCAIFTASAAAATSLGARPRNRHNFAVYLVQGRKEECSARFAVAIFIGRMPVASRASEGRGRRATGPTKTAAILARVVPGIQAHFTGCNDETKWPVEDPRRPATVTRAAL